MIDFYDKLAELGVQDILNHEPYVSPDFVGWTFVNNFLLEIVTASKIGKKIKVLVYGDYDVDGLMCAKIMQDGLKQLGVEQVDVYHYSERTHLLDTMAVQKAKLGHYDYFIVCDTGSSSMGLLNEVVSRGTKVIVLDHHVTEYPYEKFDDNIAIINTEIENALAGEPKFALSAGALCYTVMRKFCEENNLPLYEPLAAYATISLYADCMNMANKLNRAIYYEARKIPRENLPHLVTLFMNNYSNFGARFIGFWFAPRINALFRSESFDVLNRLVFDEPSFNEEVALCEIVENLYSRIRDLVKEIADIIVTDEYDHFVVGNLQSVEEFYSIDEYKLYNYTGLVANMLSEKYGKASVVTCPCGGNEIKGSLRDTFSRDYLSLFQHFCNAGGHPPAFGIHIGALDLDNFLNNLKYIDEYFPMDEVHNEPIILNMTGATPDEFLVEDIAMYNEFSGQYLPVVYIRKQIIGMREQKTKYNFKYQWGDYFIQSDYSLGFGSYVLLKPIRSLKTKLIVQ